MAARVAMITRCGTDSSHGLQIFSSGMEEEMDVGIDQAGHQGGVAQIDGLGSSGMVDGGAGGDDLLPFDQHLSGGKHAAGFDVEQARGMENDRVRCGGSLRQCSTARSPAAKPSRMQTRDRRCEWPRWFAEYQEIRFCARQAYYYDPTMRLRRKIREVTYHFEDLRDLLAKASPYRSGDALAGIAAESARAACRGANDAGRPSAARLSAAGAGALREDEVTRLIIDTHDPAAFAPVASLTVGDFRDWLLSDAATGEALAALAPGLTPEMVAAVSKLMRVQDLILVARKIRVVTRFRTTVGLPGRLSTRLQPNHPVDDPAGIAAAMVDGLLLGSGDAVIGINPASDNVSSVKTLLELIDHVRQKYAIPIQSCVLAHVSTLMAALEQGAPVDLVFQSIAGTEAANQSFGVNLALLDEACAAARALKRGASSTRRRQATLGDNVMYFETGQGSALSADAHHGVDQQTCEARAYAVARRYRPMLVNTVWALSGRSICTTASKLFAPAWKTIFAASCWGCRWGVTFATPITPKPTRTIWMCC